MPYKAKEIFEFGAFRLDVREHRLERDDGKIVGPIPDKAFQTLVHLVRNSGSLVTKRELLATIWPDTIVEENNLDKAIHTIRHALGETPGEHRYIETVRKHGYRFFADVHFENSETQGSGSPTFDRSRIAGSGTDGRDAVAILPFKNLTGNVNARFYEFALADAITTELARLRSFVVRPSSSIARYLDKEVDPVEVGKLLKVDRVLVAGFVCSKDRFRITAQLLDVATGDIVWSDLIDAYSTDILELQDAITRRIRDGLSLSSSSSEQELPTPWPTTNTEAYEEYLRGRDKLGRFMFRTLLLSDCDEAAECFVRATNLDPGFALAWSGMGACYANKISKGIGGPKDIAKAKKALERALCLNPHIPEAHVLTGWLHLASGEKQKSVEKLSYVQREFPNNAETYFLKANLHRLDGEYKESLECWDKLERLDPSCIAVSRCYRSRIYIAQGDCRKALEELSCAALAEPNHPLVNLYQVQALFYSGRAEEATELMILLLEENPQLDGVRPLLAVLHAAKNRRTKAHENLVEETLRLANVDCDVAYWTASAYALLQEKDAAFEWLERAVHLGLGDRSLIKTDETLNCLREDRRFVQLLQRI